ncbi:hypothetical protein [Antrihabitans sp. YC2-6]|uniref:hypothetical protein n=1 Tax=Antrihabitans sp. YC2-6 TaxID=2799498 RepID=UPI0018F649E8|nr:hypothetical protein [Antrihabitans sp. YC2-6]MBJ8345496.1 hypothetical protein [Antrihabitans sp. YC2-6]
MVTLPAFVWRGGFVRRAATIGIGFGGALGALAWLDSGMLLSGAIVFVVSGSCYGIWMARRMARYWPESTQLPDAERVALVKSARRGESLTDPRLASAVIAYCGGIRAAVETSRMFRWVLWFVLVVAMGVAVYDAVLGSVGNGIASAVYLAALVVEIFWWPKREAELVANCDRAAESAKQIQA